MSTFDAKGIAVALGISVAVSLGWAVKVAALTWPADKHPRGEECALCHLVDPLRQRSKTWMLEPQEAACGKCHLAAVKSGHPSGFPPGRTLPAEFPIEWTGNLTCSTCHTVHFKAGDDDANAGPHLRVDRVGRDFCLSCHEKSMFE